MHPAALPRPSGSSSAAPQRFSTASPASTTTTSRFLSALLSLLTLGTALPTYPSPSQSGPTHHPHPNSCLTQAAIPSLWSRPRSSTRTSNPIPLCGSCSPRIRSSTPTPPSSTCPTSPP